jgi:hypothetical protein
MQPPYLSVGGSRLESSDTHRAPALRGEGQGVGP